MSLLLQSTHNPHSCSSPSRVSDIFIFYPFMISILLLIAHLRQNYFHIFLFLNSPGVPTLSGHVTLGRLTRCMVWPGLACRAHALALDAFVLLFFTSSGNSNLKTIRRRSIALSLFSGGRTPSSASMKLRVSHRLRAVARRLKYREGCSWRAVGPTRLV